MEQLEIIKPGSVIKIGIGDAYYKELQDLTIYFSKQVSPEELSRQIELIRQGQELSEWGNHFRTLLTLVNEVETQARDQEMTQFISLPDKD